MAIYQLHRKKETPMYEVTLSYEHNKDFLDQLVKLNYTYKYAVKDGYITVYAENAKRLSRLATLLAQFE